MRTIVGLALLVLVLSGCSGNGGGKEEDVPEAFEEAPETAAGKGAIHGLVLTPAIVPVVGASVALSPGGLNQTTDEDGAFVFTDLEPGTYFLQVGKPGWTTIQQSVDVVADVSDPPITKIAIEKLPGTEPRVETMQQDGFIACNIGTPTLIVPCDATGAENANLFFDVEGVPSFVQTEVRWDSTQPSGDWLYLINGFCTCDGDLPPLPDDGTAGSRFDEVPDAQSPYIARANDTFLRTWKVGEDASVAQLVVSVSASGPEPERTNGSGIAYNQGFSVYATFFYNIPEPDPAWTFGENGPYIVPPA